MLNNYLSGKEVQYVAEISSFFGINGLLPWLTSSYQGEVTVIECRVRKKCALVHR